MENENFLQKLASQFGQSASVKNVYGEPIQVDEKIIIPVARIAYGLGGGYGHGYKKNKRPQAHTEINHPDGGTGEGAGGVGGMYAKPHGIYEVTPTSTRFIPTISTKQLLMGAAVGFLVRGWLYSRHRK